jgi:hypothetical protein
VGSFGSLNLSNPNLPFLNSALVQIGEELNRQARTPGSVRFSPFGALDGYIFTDPNAEMVKSLRVATSGVGILRFGVERASSLGDLPKLTSSAARFGARPPKAKPVTFHVTSESIEITEVQAGDRFIITFDQRQNVRIDNAGRFFIVSAGGSGAPLCLKVNPWIVPALSLLMVCAARKDALKELEAEIDKKVRSR